jgi:Carboxypeptidase regulatory-like domain
MLHEYINTPRVRAGMGAWRPNREGTAGHTTCRRGAHIRQVECATARAGATERMIGRREGRGAEIRAWGWVTALVVAAGAWPVAPVSAQSVTGGSVAGAVTDTAGSSLGETLVTATSEAGGASRSMTTGMDGLFALDLLPPGRYEVRVEKLGFRPVKVEDVPIRAGGRAELAVVLTPATPPVTQVDVRRYGGGPLAAARPATGESFGSVELRGLPDASRSLAQLLRMSSLGGPATGVEGLPARNTTMLVDGVPFQPAYHPALRSQLGEFGPVPLLDVQEAELLTSSPDVEYSGFSGGVLSIYTLEGGNTLHARGFGRWSGGGLSTSNYYDPGALSPSVLEGGALVSGPVVKDSAGLAVSLEARRLDLPESRIWNEAATAALTQAAQGSGVDVGAYHGPVAGTTEVIAGSARLDWQFSATERASMRASFSTTPEAAPPYGSLLWMGAATTLQGHDIATAATLASQLGSGWSSELRVGFGSSARDYGVASGLTSVPDTRLVDGGLELGSDARLPGQFRVTRVDATGVVHYTTAMNAVKMGMSASTSSYDDTYLAGLGGVFTFADAQQLAANQGVYYQAVGPAPDARFAVPQLSLFAQDEWSGAPGFTFLGGLRYDVELLPQSDVTLDTDWRQLTGLSNTTVPKTLSKFGPRAGFAWDVESRHTWIVHGEAGIYFDAAPAWALAELIGNHGETQVRRAAGSLTGWPAAPGTDQAPDAGATLTLLGPKFQAPRTSRASFGIDRRLGDFAALHVSATVRRTDFLPIRQDLNLLTAPASVDQYGRPIYGQLVKQGGLLAALPGSNRRFPGFDAVSAIDAAGRSDYRGVTLGLDVGTGSPVALFARYTYSKTTDDWPGAGSAPAESELAPFPTDFQAATDWTSGRADLDVPQRLVVGGTLSLPIAALEAHVGGLYRYRSGLPFTPGFLPGVDANGDGSASNDPAFVDDKLPGMDALLSQWPCLRTQVGGFAGRNSCRGPAVQSVDLRLGLANRGPGLVIEGFVDVIGLIESDQGIIDAALVTVDPNAPLQSGNGQVTVPLVVNPDFGKLLVRTATGRMIRIGLKVSY